MLFRVLEWLERRLKGYESSRQSLRETVLPDARKGPENKLLQVGDGCLHRRVKTESRTIRCTGYA